MNIYDYICQTKNLLLEFVERYKLFIFFSCKLSLSRGAWILQVHTEILSYENIHISHHNWYSYF